MESGKVGDKAGGIIVVDEAFATARADNAPLAPLVPRRGFDSALFQLHLGDIPGVPRDPQLVPGNGTVEPGRTANLGGRDLHALFDGSVERYFPTSPIMFEPLDREAITKVFDAMVAGRGVEVSPEAREGAIAQLDAQRTGKNFGNARAIREAIDAIVAKRG